MERITRRSVKTLDAKDDKNGVSAPPTAGHAISPPPLLFPVYHTCAEFIASKHYVYECPENEDDWLDSTSCMISYYPSDGSGNVRRYGRKSAAYEFRSEYTYGSEDGQKTCVWPGDIVSWHAESSGIMWVGVHGTDSICVVTRSDDLDTTRLRGSLKHQSITEILFRFRKNVIVEIEDLADPADPLEGRYSEMHEKFNKCIEKPFGYNEMREKFHKLIEKPFGVVSVIPAAYKSRKVSGHKVSSVEYGETKAIEFLREKMKSDTVFTVKETIQTAIAAFGHLIQKKLNADEIQVSVMDPNYRVGPFEGKDTTVEDLTVRQINEHLAVIKKLGPSAKRKIEPRPSDSSSGSRRLRQRKL